MRRLAQIFSALVLLALIIAAAALFYVRPAIVPSQIPLSGPVDRIIIDKTAREMRLVKDGETLRRYNIALGFSPKGDKSRQGDGRTPEGLYQINRRNESSAYHLSLGLDYPLPEDIDRAKSGGYDPGGDIMIHGQPNALPDGLQIKGDWTAGCIAISNAQMREIWPVIPVGTVVEVRP